MIESVVLSPVCELRSAEGCRKWGSANPSRPRRWKQGTQAFFPPSFPFLHRGPVVFSRGSNAVQDPDGLPPLSAYAIGITGSMSDDEPFSNLPGWEDLDFAADCDAWGNWLATFIQPNTWDPATSLDGSFATSLVLYQAASESAFAASPALENTPHQKLAGDILGWWAYHLYGMVILDDNETVSVDQNADFMQHVIVAPSEKCPDEMCKAFGFSGNDDITGIGVSSSHTASSCPSRICSQLLFSGIRCIRHIACRPFSRQYTSLPSQSHRSESPPTMLIASKAIPHSPPIPAKTGSQHRTNRSSPSAAEHSTPSAARSKPSSHHRCSCASPC